MVFLWVLLGLVALAFALYVVVIIAVARFSVRPFRIPIYLSPGGMGTPQESVAIAHPGRPDIYGWYVPGEGEVVALLLHGYMMNRSELAPNAKWLHERGIGSLMIDFSGHGRARHPITGLGYPERFEVLSCVRWLREKAPGAKIVFIGSSMGSVASALALAEDPTAADALVLDSAYSKMNEAIDRWWSMFSGPLGQMLLRPTIMLSKPIGGFDPNKIDIAEALKKSSVPVLVLHGDKDHLAPPDHAERNLAALGDRGRLVWFPGCRHSEGRWEQPERYFEALEAFLDENGFLRKKVLVEV